MNLFGISLFGNNNKDYLEEFKKDKQKISPPFRPIADETTDSALNAINELHGYASKLSSNNKTTYKRILKSLTGIGIFIALIFVAYDEMDWHWLSALLLALVILLIIVHIYSLKTDCHRKYIEYRILAEATRIQYYLSIKHIQKPVFEIMPWFLQEAASWIEEPLSKLPIDGVTESNEKIKEIWIIDQKKYHLNKLNKAEEKKKWNDIVQMIVIAATIFLYFFACLYEFFIFDYVNSIMAFLPISPHVILKIAIGTASVGSLLAVSYFGKLSLSEKIDAHSRMVKLYEQAERNPNIENDLEKLEQLAREFLIENSAWYSYQIKNKPELVL